LIRSISGRMNGRRNSIISSTGSTALKLIRSSVVWRCRRRSSPFTRRGAKGPSVMDLVAFAVDLGPGGAHVLEERLDQVQRHREQDRVAPLAGDVDQRLQVAELERAGLGVDHPGRVGQLPRGLELALGVDDLGPLL